MSMSQSEIEEVIDKIVNMPDAEFADYLREHTEEWGINDNECREESYDADRSNNSE